MRIAKRRVCDQQPLLLQRPVRKALCPELEQELPCSARWILFRVVSRTRRRRERHRGAISFCMRIAVHDDVPQKVEKLRRAIAARLEQEQLRRLSRQILSAQEEERKKISRELHDVIAQTLTGINVRLSALKKEALVNTKGLDRNIARTQRLVEHSVNIVHRFARELRPAVR